MVLLDRVTAIEEDAVTAETILKKGTLAGGDEGAPVAWALEIAAQACAVFIGFAHRDRGFREGRLVKASGLSFHIATLPFDRTLRVEARLTSATELGFYVFDTALTGPDTNLIFRGRLSILAR